MDEVFSSYIMFISDTLTAFVSRRTLVNSQAGTTTSTGLHAICKNFRHATRYCKGYVPTRFQHQNAQTSYQVLYSVYDPTRQHTQNFQHATKLCNGYANVGVVCCIIPL